MLPNGTKVKLFVQAEDKAHNLGPEKEAVIAMTGVTIVALKEDEPTAVEYEHITMALPAMGKDSNIKGVMIKEIDSPILHENSTNPILSPIYSFTTLADDGKGNLIEQEHTHFDEEVVFFRVWGFAADPAVHVAFRKPVGLPQFFCDPVGQQLRHVRKRAVVQLL